MAKGSSNAGKGAGAGKDKGDADAGWGMDAIPDALKEAGRRAAELSQNPYARGLLAAGLVAAAAALASNKNVRDTTRRNLRGATEAAEVAAENAGKIGLAIVNAATEAVQSMLNLGAGLADASQGGQPGGGKASKSSPRKAAGSGSRSKAAGAKSGAKRSSSGARKGSAKPAGGGAARTGAAKAGSTPGARKSGAKSAGGGGGKTGSAKAGSASGAPKSGAKSSGAGAAGKSGRGGKGAARNSG